MPPTHVIEIITAFLYVCKIGVVNDVHAECSTSNRAVRRRDGTGLKESAAGLGLKIIVNYKSCEPQYRGIMC